MIYGVFIKFKLFADCSVDVLDVAYIDESKAEEYAKHMNKSNNTEKFRVKGITVR
jgi:hypothetical protein